VLNERITRGALEEAAREQRKANRFVESSLQNAEVVVALGMQDNVIARWRKLGQRGTAAQARAGRLGGIFSGSTKFFRQALQTLMLGVGAWAVIEMQASSGIMIAATIILGKALAPVELAVAGWRAFVDARGAYTRLDE
jgi:ABC-type protease/lipase transport system fused ATPase/permease subunit